MFNLFMLFNFLVYLQAPVSVKGIKYNSNLNRYPQMPQVYNSHKEFSKSESKRIELIELLHEKRKHDDLIAKNRQYADDEIYVCRMHNTDVHLNCYYKWLTISENLRVRIEKLNDELVPSDRKHTIKDIQDWEIYPNIVLNSNLNSPERILVNFYCCVNPICLEKMSSTIEISLGLNKTTKVYVTKNTDEFKTHLLKYHNCVKVSDTKMKLFYDSKYFQIISQEDNFKHSGSIAHPVSHFRFCEGESAMKSIVRTYKNQSN
jgi:hypothetical protein